jgi:integrase
LPRYLIKRDGFWHFCRRVPEPLVDLDRRGIVRQSTKIRVLDDPRAVRAAEYASRFNVELEAYWKGLLDGQSAEAKLRYEQARRRARALGFTYATVAELAAQPSINDIVARVLALVRTGAVDDDAAAAAVFGLEPPPQLVLSELFDEFEKLERASISDYSEDQLRKWRNPRRRAVANMIKVVGDKPIAAITRTDALDFRAWWQDRILSDDLDIGSANKDIGHLNNMLKIVDTALQLRLPPLFADLRIRGGHDRQRKAFTSEWLRAKFLESGILNSLNDEARGVIHLMMETGLRITEAVNLSAENIVLTGPIPHVRVRPENRRLKTPQSEREIPLVGVALAAMLRHPNGFPRYYDAADTCSATVNKFLGEHGLRPSDDHTLYSLRHSFEDRLYAVDCPEKYIVTLMGQKYGRPKYGGPTLAELRRWLEKIAFTVPA